MGDVPFSIEKKNLTISDSITPSPFRTYAGINPYSGAWTTNEIVHLLKRCMFGVKWADIQYYKSKTLSQTVDELLNNPFGNLTPPINDYNDAFYTDPYISLGQTWINRPYDDNNADFRRIDSMRRWSLGVMIYQSRSIGEKMCLFWHNHFATRADIGNARIGYNHIKLLRDNALGNFKDFTRKVTIDCHMLRFLNGEQNNKSAPDENYSRELQELFCIGKGPNSRYTENDVKEAAKALTGWQVNYDTGVPYFTPDRHDTTDKTFSAFYNNKVIKGQTGANAGNIELDDLLNMIFSNNETALFICRKLYRWFVYYDIDAITEANVIAPLANILRTNNYDVKPVLSALLKSEHFFDVINQGCMIKSPIDFCIALMREFNVVFPPSTVSNIRAFSGHMSEIMYRTSLQGQDYGNPPNVAGWQAYYQFPSYNELWINSTTYPERNSYASDMIRYGMTHEGTNAKIDVIEFAKSLSNPGDPNILINDSLTVLYRMALQQPTKDKIKKDILLTGQTTDAYWTQAWGAYIADPNNTDKKQTVETRLKSLYTYILNLPEFHLV
jgi:uncharacterized protein (DUF1800 family)